MNRAERRRQAKVQKRGEANYSVNKNGLLLQKAGTEVQNP